MKGEKVFAQLKKIKDNREDTYFSMLIYRTLIPFFPRQTTFKTLQMPKVLTFVIHRTPESVLIQQLLFTVFF